MPYSNDFAFTISLLINQLPQNYLIMKRRKKAGLSKKTQPFIIGENYGLAIFFIPPSKSFTTKLTNILHSLAYISFPYKCRNIKLIRDFFRVVLPQQLEAV